MAAKKNSPRNGGAADDELQRELESLVAKPGDDPYELEWPDDAKEQRAAERAAKAKREAIKPAPRLLAATVIGLSLPILFIVPIALVAGAPALVVAVAFPIVLLGLLTGLPSFVLIEKVGARFPRGVTDVSLLIVGGGLGFGLTYVMFTYAYRNEPDIDGMRQMVSLLMMTAVAASMMAAHGLADQFRMKPRAVWVSLAVLVLVTVASLVSAAAGGAAA